MLSPTDERLNWAEYLMEALGLGLFMISACAFGVLFFHPDSPAVLAIPETTTRRVLMGVAMGLTSIGLVYSPWGMRSGAHFNPAFTLTFLHLKKIRPRDAGGYIVAQFLGAVLGVMLAATILGPLIADASVNYVVTVPGPAGVAAAFLAEIVISGVLMLVVLLVSNTPRVARFTGVTAGLLIALYISLESPISGMSMNPARTFGSAYTGGVWTAFWVYLAAPLLGMLLAAEGYARSGGQAFCAKLVHHPTRHCIFCEGRRRSQGKGAKS